MTALAKKRAPVASTGLLDGVPISTCQIAADVRDDMRSIAGIEQTTLVEYLDVILRKFIRSYGDTPGIKLKSLKRRHRV